MIDTGLCRLRPWRTGDLDHLVRNANDRDVWLNLRDSFPYPYTEADGLVWLSASETNPFNFAIEVDGHAAGSLGFTPGDDVHRVSAEIGYWLGRRYWGRGIASAAVKAASAWAFETFEWRRLFAGVFAPNVASMRVLEKAGFQREGVLHNAVIKDGRVLDQVQYALTR